MKKILLAAVATVSLMSAQAQKAYQPVSFLDNWSVGLDGGVTTPLAKGHAFFGDMRGAFGLHVQKQVSPVVAVGVEGLAGVNTSSWNKALFEDTFADYESFLIEPPDAPFRRAYLPSYQPQPPHPSTYRSHYVPTEPSFFLIRNTSLWTSLDI